MSESETHIVSLRHGLVGHRLTRPRAVRVNQERPATLVGFVTDIHGRKLFAEILTHTTFVRPDDVEELSDVSAR